MSSEHWDYELNRTLAHTHGLGDFFDGRWDYVRRTHPAVDWSDMCVFRGQILMSSLPDDPKRDDLIRHMMLVAEPSAATALMDGHFDKATSEKVEPSVDQIVVMPSAVYFMNGIICRAAMVAGSYATLTAIKMCRVGGGNPELLLATPDGRVTLSVDEARKGLNRLMRLEVGKHATALPVAGDIGPYFTDPDLAKRISL